MRLPSLVHGFAETLWQTAPLRARSRECTPLYVDRYRGPRRSAKLTAHPWWELTCALGGTGALTGRQRLPLAVHDICLIPPRARHDEVSDEDFDTIWIGFLGTRVPRLTQPVVIRSEPLTRQIEQLWLLAQRRGEPIGPELDAATAAVLARFLRQLQEGGAAGDTDLMGRAVRYLGQHLTEEIFVPAVARKFGCSEGHFHRLFKQQTGQTPMAYLTRLRGQHAAHLLTQTDLPVAEIARQVGYTDPLYFSRVLRQMTGLSPTQYRAQHRRSIHH